MTLLRTGSNRTPMPPLILVVDDDARVVELLQLALVQQHLRVITAFDGDEAIRRALAERPDLIILEARLPKKSGLEVCDFLRHDPEDPNVPIVLLSTSGETESRLDGLARGADDYMAKPFSPKELIARVQRLLARSNDARVQRRRSTELERDLSRAQEEARRSHAEMLREQRLRELAFGLGRELQRTLDLDALADRMLAAVRAQLGGVSVAWLAPREDAQGYEVREARGSLHGRLDGIMLASDGELTMLLAGLGRPVARDALLRFPELRHELGSFLAAGVSWFVPLRQPQGLEGILVFDDRSDGVPLSKVDQDALAALAELASSALLNARRFRTQQDQMLQWVSERAADSPALAAAIPESAEWVEAAAVRVQLPWRMRSLLRHAARCSAWGWSEAGREALRSLEPADPTGRVARLRGLIADGESLETDHVPVERRRSAVLLGVAVRFAIARGSGRSRQEAWSTAMAWASLALDPPTRTALDEAFHAMRAAVPQQAA